MAVAAIVRVPSPTGWDPNAEPGLTNFIRPAPRTGGRKNRNIYIYVNVAYLAQCVSGRKNCEDLSPLSCCALYT
jgi:hypothetical protein